MALTNNLKVLELDFKVYGVNLINEAYVAEHFLKGKGYSGFLVKRKLD